MQVFFCFENKGGDGMAQGKGGGQPLKWGTPEELEQKINDYYQWARDNYKRITVTGLAWWLGTNRTTLLNYENSEENGWLDRCSKEDRRKYVNAIKQAKAFIEMNYEESLFNKGEATGAIFTLKNNYNWKDKQEVVTTNNNIEVALED